METTVNEINSFTRELDIHVQWDEMKDSYADMVRKYHSDYARKGFRKGKVPMTFFKKEMGPALDAEYSDKAVNDFYFKALKDHNLTPINRAQIDHFHFHENSDLHFKAQFEIIPTFKLPDFGDKLKFTLTEIHKTDRDLQSSLERLQQNFVTYETLEGPAQEGNFLFGDLQELDQEGNPKPDKLHKDQTIKIDRTIFSEDDIRSMVGKIKGESCRIYPVSNEQKSAYEIHIREVRKDILPTLDDEFAKKVRPDVETLEQLKQSINTEIQQELDKTNRQSRDNHIIDYFIQNTNFDIPSSMLDKYLDGVVEEFKEKAQPGQPVNEQQIREDYKTLADNSMRWMMVKSELIKHEGLKIDDSHLEKKYQSLSESFNMTPEKVEAVYKKSGKFDEFKDELLDEVLFDHLASMAKIKIVSKTTDQMKEEK